MDRSVQELKSGRCDYARLTAAYYEAEKIEQTALGDGSENERFWNAAAGIHRQTSYGKLFVPKLVP